MSGPYNEPSDVLGKLRVMDSDTASEAADEIERLRRERDLLFKAHSHELVRADMAEGDCSWQLALAEECEADIERLCASVEDLIALVEGRISGAAQRDGILQEARAALSVRAPSRETALTSMASDPASDRSA